MILKIILLLFSIILILLFHKLCNIQKKNFNQPNNEKYKLCIMAIFKNEEEYMEEWLIHHINQGITHFYLYSNDPDTDKYLFLNNYKQYITLIPWINFENDKNGTIQKKAYAHCIRNYNKEFRYIMMLDLDEFIISLDKNKKVINVINDLDYKTPQFKAAKVPRFDFGSNGYLTKPIGNLMDVYTKREKICSSYKTIANVNYIDLNDKFYYVHDFTYNRKIGHVYNNYFKYAGSIPVGCEKNTINEIPLAINHYYIKSYDEYMKRCDLWKNGGVNNIHYRQNCDKTFYEKDKSRNDTIDDN